MCSLIFQFISLGNTVYRDDIAIATLAVACVCVCVLHTTRVQRLNKSIPFHPILNWMAFGVCTYNVVSVVFALFYQTIEWASMPSNCVVMCKIVDLHSYTLTHSQHMQLLTISPFERFIKNASISSYWNRKLKRAAPPHPSSTRFNWNGMTGLCMRDISIKCATKWIFSPQTMLKCGTYDSHTITIYLILSGASDIFLFIFALRPALI